MTRRVVFGPEAQDHLSELYRYIADASTPDVGAHFTEAIVRYCEDLVVFPHRGTARDDIRPGLRTTSYRKRTVIAFTISADQITVLGVFHGGRDYEAILGT